MPGGDRTGPMGMGPMTGRGAGFCAGYGVPGFMNRAFGAGFLGRGRGGGRGWRNMFYATGLPGWMRAAGGGMAGAAGAAGSAPALTPEQEIHTLKQQAEQAANVLESIRQRISELEAKASQ